MLWSNTAYCVKLSGEDLSCYSNEIESACLRKCPHYHYITKKVMPQYKHLAERKTAVVDMTLTKKLPHCHPLYRVFTLRPILG